MNIDDISSSDEIELKTTRILTEHFGFQPIAVIDDIINVINEIMYRCTEQLEQILITQKEQIDEHERDMRLKRKNDDVIMDNNNDNSDNNTSKYTVDDIQRGTATLESFFEHNINRNFDKFEIYALRNVFNIPEDLVTGGFIRLKHHEGLKLYNDINQKEMEINDKMMERIKEIKYQIELNKVLCESVTKFHKLSKLTKLLRIRLKPFINKDNNGIDTEKNKKFLAELSPINDTIVFLITQVRNTYDKINDMKELIQDEKLTQNFRCISKEDEQLDARINVVIGKVFNSTKRLGDDVSGDGVLDKNGNFIDEDLVNFFSDNKMVL